jgi:hypothetical protein
VAAEAAAEAAVVVAEAAVAWSEEESLGEERSARAQAG